MNEKEIIIILIDELQKRNIIKKNYSTFKNTEQILFDYPKLKESIRDREEQIEDYIKYGLPEKSKSITTISNNNNIKKDKEDIIASSINGLQKDIYKTKVIIKFIDTVLNRFKSDPYYQIIHLYYFEGNTYEQIAEKLDNKKRNNDKPIAISTIATNKNRLIRELQKYIFPNDYLYQLLGY